MSASRPVTATDRLLIPLGLFLSALVLRLIWTWNTHSPTLDTAVVGLMALDIQEGSRPLFFTGQGYMGALEAYLTAGVFEVFGADRFTMTFVPSFFGACWPVMVFWILRTSFDRLPALIGAGMVVFPASYLLRYSSVPYGGYPETYVFGSALMLHALVRTLQDRVLPWRDALLFSTLLFLGVWTNLQIVPYLAAASVFWLRLLWFRRRTPGDWMPFFLAPVACALAFLPQVMLSAQNSASPPLFSSLSSARILRSLRALVTYDLPQLIRWLDSPDVFQKLSLATMGSLCVLGCLSLVRKKNSPKSLLWMTALFLLSFSVLYFPHPMSGFVPRYVISPFAWVIAVLAAAAVSVRSGVLRWIALGVWGAILVLQVIQFPLNIRVLRAELDVKMEEIHTVIRVAREANLDALRFIGSGMEGHRAAAFAFEAKQEPVFVSSYDERRRDADLFWHTSTNAGYFFTEAYEPFVRGSLAAMNLDAPDIRTAGRFRIMNMPSVFPPAHAVMLPHTYTVTSVPDGAETLGDLAEASWRVPSEGARLTVNVEQPEKVSGIRFAAPPESSLPYQYTVTLTLADGSEEIIQQTSTRLGSSYVEGGRVYFKGFLDIQDIRWEPRSTLAVHLDLVPGRLNKLPVRVQTLEVFAEAKKGEEGIRWDVLQDQLESAPEVPVIASDAIATRIRREPQFLSEKQLDRIPVPWNPRDPDAQPVRFSFDMAQGVLLFFETSYAERMQQLLTSHHVNSSVHLAGDIAVLYAESTPSSPDFRWELFRVVVEEN